MKMLKIALSILLLSLTQVSFSAEAPSDIAGTTAALQAADPQAKPKEEIEYRSGTPEENCHRTATNAVRECQNPSGQGFKQAMALATAVPGLAMGFMSGGDSGKMAEMCQMSVMANALNTLLNQVMGDGCNNGSAACQTVCGESQQALQTQLNAAYAARDSFEVDRIKGLQKQVQDTEAKCVDDVTKIQTAANSQQQSGQQPGQDMSQCNAMLDDDGAGDEPVDCNLYPGDPQCNPLGKTDGNPIGFDSTPNNIPIGGTDGNDLPLDPSKDDDFWNNLKNKTSGDGGGAGAGSGLAGFGGGGSGSGSGTSNKAGGASKRGSASFMGGAGAGGGGGGGALGTAGDLDNNLASLDKKKKDLKMLTKKKLGARGVASSEFGLASDDIWTRLYLRTNTRCTKQLVECAANKSVSPYGVTASTKAR